MFCNIFRLSLKQSYSKRKQTKRRAGNNFAVASGSEYTWIWSGVPDQESTNHSAYFVEREFCFQREPRCSFVEAKPRRTLRLTLGPVIKCFFYTSQFKLRKKTPKKLFALSQQAQQICRSFKVHDLITWESKVQVVVYYALTTWSVPSWSWVRIPLRPALFSGSYNFTTAYIVCANGMINCVFH